jgi:hypothetical protein
MLQRLDRLRSPTRSGCRGSQHSPALVLSPCFPTGYPNLSLGRLRDAGLLLGEVVEGEQVEAADVVVP